MNYELKLDATLKQVQGDCVVFCDGFRPTFFVERGLEKQGGNKNAKKNVFRGIYIDNQAVDGVTVLPEGKRQKTSILTPENGKKVLPQIVVSL